MSLPPTASEVLAGAVLVLADNPPLVVALRRDHSPLHDACAQGRPVRRKCPLRALADAAQREVERRRLEARDVLTAATRGAAAAGGGVRVRPRRPGSPRRRTSARGRRAA